MQVWKDHDLVWLLRIIVLDDVCQPVVKACLQRGSTRDKIRLMLQLYDIAVMIKELVLFDLRSLHLIDQIIPDLYDLVVIVDVTFNEVVQV